jgi:hypothetical protein
MPPAGRKKRLIPRFNDGHFFKGGIGIMVGRIERFPTFEPSHILVRPGGIRVLVFCDHDPERVVSVFA